MTIDTDRLRALAEAATPGPWVREGSVVWSRDAHAVVCGASAAAPASGRVEYERPTFSNMAQPAANAAYLAAVHPGAVLALLDQIVELEATLEAHRCNLAKFHELQDRIRNLGMAPRK